MVSIQELQEMSPINKIKSMQVCADEHLKFFQASSFGWVTEKAELSCLSTWG